jgi:hypothetical protein
VLLKRGKKGFRVQGSGIVGFNIEIGIEIAIDSDFDTESDTDVATSHVFYLVHAVRDTTPKKFLGSCCR